MSLTEKDVNRIALGLCKRIRLTAGKADAKSAVSALAEIGELVNVYSALATFKLDDHKSKRGAKRRRKESVVEPIAVEASGSDKGEDSAQEEEQ